MNKAADSQKFDKNGTKQIGGNSGSTIMKVQKEVEQLTELLVDKLQFEEDLEIKKLINHGKHL